MQGKEKVQSSLFGTRPLEELLPQDHPLRKIRALADEAWGNLASAFDTAYGTVGNVSYQPAVLLRAHLLRALYSIKSERALCEQIEMNAGFRWFVGLDWDDKVFDHSTLSFNRERLFGSGAAEAFLGEVVRLAQKQRLLQSDRLVVDGTLIKAWASHKSFRPKDEEGASRLWAARVQGDESLQRHPRVQVRPGRAACAQWGRDGSGSAPPGCGGLGRGERIGARCAASSMNLLRSTGPQSWIWPSAAYLRTAWPRRSGRPLGPIGFDTRLSKTTKSSGLESGTLPS